MNETTVVNLTKDAFDVYIGRPSAFGNPFSIGKDGKRSEVIDMFEAYWYAPEQAQLRQKALEELQGKRLGCYCKPNRCHGDIIAHFINESTKKNNTTDLTEFLE